MPVAMGPGPSSLPDTPADLTGRTSRTAGIGVRKPVQSRQAANRARQRAVVIVQLFLPFQFRACTCCTLHEYLLCLRMHDRQVPKPDKAVMSIIPCHQHVLIHNIG